MRQPWRQQPHKPILVRLFSSNINFKGVYLQQDIITRPSIVSVHTCLFFTILISFHKISYLNQSMLEVDRDTLIEQSHFYKCHIFIL